MKAELVHREPVITLELSVEEYNTLYDALNEKEAAGRLYTTVQINLLYNLSVFNEEVVNEEVPV